jgi:hypothetical protein
MSTNVWSTGHTRLLPRSYALGSTRRPCASRLPYCLNDRIDVAAVVQDLVDLFVPADQLRQRMLSAMWITSATKPAASMRAFSNSTTSGSLFTTATTGSAIWTAPAVNGPHLKGETQAGS